MQTAVIINVTLQILIRQIFSWFGSCANRNWLSLTHDVLRPQIPSNTV